jgi:hypothetical protein
MTGAFSAIALSAPSRFQRHRAFSAIALSAPSRFQRHRPFSAIALSAPSRFQRHRAFSAIALSGPSPFQGVSPGLHTCRSFGASTIDASLRSALCLFSNNSNILSILFILSKLLYRAIAVLRPYLFDKSGRKN